MPMTLHRATVIGVASVAGMLARAEIMRAEAVARPWKASLSLGVSLTRGNSETLLTQGAFEAERKGEVHGIRLGAQGNYGETETIAEGGGSRTDVNVQTAKAYAEYRRGLTGRMYGAFNSEVSHDYVADLRYRLLIGPGLGFDLLRRERADWSADLGVSYRHDRLRDDTTEDTVSLRLAERAQYRFQAGAKIWQSAEYLPSVEDLSDYLLSAEVGSEAAMNARLNLRVVLQDKYDSTPPTGRKSNDVLLTAGLSWKL